jgi:hypothetical protein
MTEAAVSRPKVFVGSSMEGKNIAHAVRQQLKDIAEVDLWSDGLFGLGSGTLASLVMALPKFDFAVLVLTPDDLTISRGMKKASPRDNVVFEAGLFMGRLEPSRTFLVYDTINEPKLPSDLGGITYATFRSREAGNLQATVGEATDIIRVQIQVLGPFLALDTPSTNDTVERKVRARGRCSTNHKLVCVAVHPISTDGYWLRRAVVGVGQWEADLIIGMESGSSGHEFEVRAFLDPTPRDSGGNPLSAWPAAAASTPPIRIWRA